jgi:hypothetical protein
MSIGTKPQAEVAIDLGLSPTREREIVDELAQHLDDRWGELVSGGASPKEAEVLALAEVRDRDTLTRFLAPLRQAHTPPPLTPGFPTGRWLNDLWRDVRYAVRMLRRRPVFSVVRAALLAPLPLADADRLVIVWEGYPPGQPRAAVSVPGSLDIRGARDVFTDAAASQVVARKAAGTRACVEASRARYPTRRLRATAHASSPGA